MEGGYLTIRNNGFRLVRELPTLPRAPSFPTVMFAGFPKQPPLLTVALNTTDLQGLQKELNKHSHKKSFE